MAEENQIIPDSGNQLQRAPSIGASPMQNTPVAPTQPPAGAVPDFAQTFPNGGDELGSLISTATLGQFGQTPPGQLSQDQALLQNLIDAQTPSAQIGDPGTASLFPGQNQPIQVGQVGGQIIGSQPVFVRTGGLAPVGVIGARQKALEDAAKARAKQLKPFELPKGPTIKDPRFQSSLNEITNSGQDAFIQRAQREFGDQAFAALQNPKTQIGREFIRFMDNLDVLAGESDQIIELFAGIDEGLESGDQFFSEETLGLRDDFEKLTGALADGNVSSLVNLRGSLNKLQGHLSLDKMLNDQKIVSSIKGRLVEKAGVKDFSEYLKVTKRGTKTFDEDVATIANQLANTTMRSQIRAGVLTEDDIRKSISARLGSEITKDVKVVTKKKGGAGRSDVDPNNINVQNNKKIGLQTTDADGNVLSGQTVDANNYIPAASGAKPVNIVGAQVIDPDTGEVITQESGTKNGVLLGPAQIDVVVDGQKQTKDVMMVKTVVETPVLDKDNNPVFDVKDFTDQETGETTQVRVPKTEKTEKTEAIDFENNRATWETNMPNIVTQFDQIKTKAAPKAQKTIPGISPE